MYDVIIRNGTIVDGSGGKPFTGDVAIRIERQLADEDLEQDFDLCVVDGRSLDRLWAQVHERKEREPCVNR